MTDYELINILDMINAIGEKELKIILSDFFCPMNYEIENFIKNNAIHFIFTNLQRIKKAEKGENAELDYQIAITKAKLESFGINVSEFELK